MKTISTGAGNIGFAGTGRRRKCLTHAIQLFSRRFHNIRIAPGSRSHTWKLFVVTEHAAHSHPHDALPLEARRTKNNKNICGTVGEQRQRRLGLLGNPCNRERALMYSSTLGLHKFLWFRVSKFETCTSGVSRSFNHVWPMDSWIRICTNICCQGKNTFGLIVVVLHLP